MELDELLAMPVWDLMCRAVLGGGISKLSLSKVMKTVEKHFQKKSPLREPAPGRRDDGGRENFSREKTEESSGLHSAPRPNKGSRLRT